MKKPIQIKVDEVDLREWNERAAAAGMSLSAWIRLKCATEIPGSNPGREAEHVASGSTEAGGLKPPSAERPKGARGELAEAVAGRTRHTLGCDCFDCVQAGRFFKSMRKEGQ